LAGSRQAHATPARVIPDAQIRSVPDKLAHYLINRDIERLAFRLQV